MQYGAAGDPHARVRHVLQNQLATISGWSQLLARENGGSEPDPARLAELSARLKADIARMSATIDDELGPSNAAPPGNGDGHILS